jgi:LruC domain-containing protein
MKKNISKTGIVLLIGLLISFNTKAQLTLTCESGNRATEQAACWGFGSTGYISTAGSIIAGSYSAQSNQLTNPAPTASWVKTPWMKIGNGNISLKAKLSAANGTTRGVVFAYVPYNPANPPYFEGVPVPYDSTKWTTMNTNLVDVSSTLPAAIANSNDVYKIRISFVGTGGNSRMISDNYVIPGTYWSDPSNGCIPLPTIQDTDLDGVADADDAFPTDQYKAYKTFFPVPDHFSTLAFEDLWPAKGDFDFNDLVIDHFSEVVSNAQNQVVEVNYKFKVRATGASFNNGFGFELININPNAIRNVTGTVIQPGSIYQIAANGCETGQSNATIIAIGNVKDVLPYPGGGVAGVNTTIGAPYTNPQIVNVKLTFIENGVPGAAGAVNISQLGSNTFNPFIVINQIRGKEVHLPDYKPTDLVNSALFGTLEDDSNPALNRYYRTKTNLPWAISTYESFQYPIEKTDISLAYPKLIDWVISNGTQFPDWDSNPIYRVNSYIYTQP